MPAIDYPALHVALIEATVGAFLELAVNAQLRSETIYVTGLYSCGELSYLYPTANTEQSLARACASEPSDLSAFFRWNPCNWEYHALGQQHFATVETLLAAGWESDYSAFRVDRDRIVAIALHSLRELAQHSIFRDLHAEHPILLNLFMGDQSIAQRLRYAALVNDDATLALYRRQVQGA